MFRPRPAILLQVVSTSSELAVADWNVPCVNFRMGLVSPHIQKEDTEHNECSSIAGTYEFEASPP